MVRKKVVIIGGGFAGLNLATALNKKKCEVVLIDKQNHHMFQPLFYQVASARLEPSSISFPFRSIFKGSKNVEFRFEEILAIDPDSKSLTTHTGEIAFDELVIATGCSTNYFGNAELEKFALPMKTTQETIRIRNTILSNFERLMGTPESEQAELLNLVIVGAGPTGVELAGAFAEMKKNILPKDYPQYDFSKLTISLIEGSPNTLNAMGTEARSWSKKYLEELNVEVKVNTIVESYNGHTLQLKNGDSIPTQMVIWAAGVQGNVLKGLDNATIVRSRYTVNRQSQIDGYQDIYAIGDVSYMETDKFPQGHPQLANVAINQGKVLAKNLIRKWNNQDQSDFEYSDKGTMATVGKHKAVVELPFVKFHGYFAWMVWMALHLMLILSVRNKLIVFYNWAWSYITGNSSLRLILSNEWKKKE